MTKLGIDIQLHKQTLIKILIDLAKEMGEKIAFKGGTCAYLFYDLPRLSLDLDFDVLADLTEEDVEKIKYLLARHGAIKDFRQKHNTIFFLLDYLPNTPNIKIEFNKRVWENNNYKTIWFLGVEIAIADEQTIFTNKLVALTDRRQVLARDLFDVYYFLTIGLPVNEKLIKERTGKTVREYLKLLPKFIKTHYSEKNILSGLGEILAEKQKTWAKKELIKEAIKWIEKLINTK